MKQHKFSKFLSLFLCFSLVMGILPTMPIFAADGTAQSILSVELTNFTVPVYGAAPDYTASVPEGANYQIESFVWTCTDENGRGVDMVPGDKFDNPDRQYTAMIGLAPNQGYDFPQNLEGMDVKFDGTMEYIKAYHCYNHILYIETVSFSVSPNPAAPEKITSVEVKDLTLPVYGAAPDYTASVPEGANYQIDNIGWLVFNELGAYHAMGPGDKFDNPNTTYFANISVTVKEGYAFSPEINSSHVKINGSADHVEGIGKNDTKLVINSKEFKVTAPAHTHTGTKVTGQAPTCAAEGWKDYYQCECGKFFEDEACTKEITDLAAWKTGAGKLDKTEHFFGEWTFDENFHWKICLKCNAECEKAAHDMEEWNVVKPATETENGLRQRSCSCGYFEEEVIPMLVHTHTAVKVTGQAPTYEKDGWKDYYQCECGKFFEDAECTEEIPDLDAWKVGAGRLDKLQKPDVPAPSGGSGSASFPVVLPKQPENGTIEVNHSHASSGDTVIVTVKPQNGYVLDDLKVTDRRGNALEVTDNKDGTYSFEMPFGKVNIDAVFQPAPSAGMNWHFDGKRWSYQSADGKVKTTGWAQLMWNGKKEWYHFDKDGFMNTGWFCDADKNWYFLHNVSDGKLGVMQTGWLKVGAEWYYLNPVSNGKKGAMLTGWQNLSGEWYYLNPVSDGTKGRLFVSTTTPDGYRVNEAGKWIR